MRFDEARSHVPLTAPSHATILTGVLPPRHGIRGNGTFRLRADAPALAEALRGAGYHTAAVVASVVLDRATGLDRGFEIYDDNQRRGPRAAFQYLERGATQVEASADAILGKLSPPFFLWVHFYDPHVPWVAPREFGSGYDAEIAFADAALGRVVEAAKARAGNALVVVAAADHGESLGEHGENQHGYTLHRGVLRVPLIVSGPSIPRGLVIRDTIGLVDVAPTIADLAGVALPGASGRSLRRAWDGRSSSSEEGPLWEETLHPLFDSGWAPLRGLLDPRWHFVDAPRPELYDRAADGNDRTDVAKAHAETVEAMRARLGDLGRAMGDVPEPEDRPAATPEEKERQERLASLGYLGGSAGSPPVEGRLDPKDGLPGFLAVEEAERALDAGDAARARALVEPFLARDPRNPRLWHTLSKAKALLSDLDGAEAAIERALTLTPGRPFLLYTQADILRRRGDELGVTRVLEAIVRDDPRAVEASVELAAMAFRRGDRARSEAILAASYDAGARDPDLLDRLGQTMALDGRDADAVRYFDEALDLWPDDPAALLGAARADLRANDATRALSYLRRCGSFECRMELARAYVLGSHDLAAAKRELAAARALATPAQAAEIDRHLAAIDALNH